MRSTDKENEPTIVEIVSRWSKYVERLVKEEGPLIDELAALNRPAVRAALSLARYPTLLTLTSRDTGPSLVWLTASLPAKSDGPTAIDRNSFASRHYFQRQCMTRRIMPAPVASRACVYVRTCLLARLLYFSAYLHLQSTLCLLGWELGPAHPGPSRCSQRSPANRILVINRDRL